jgi:murein DD-endopeptidase MepM/ murein hydrolase activator NlpD
MRRTLSVGVALAVVAGVAIALAMMDWPLRSFWPNLRPQTPHQRYASSLAEGGLAHTALATDWLAAAARALAQPAALSVPFTEDALVDPARPVSLGYAVTLKRGQKLDVQVTVVTDRPGQVFVDLFEPDADGESNRRAVASARQDETALSYEARRSGSYILRIQPELLRGGHMRVTSAPAPALEFPVSGGGAANIQSIFGDQRDAGRRSHEGIDIFAPRGTPVLTASDGFVTSVGQNRLGGNVVWVWNPSRGVRLYYAHLQEQLVRNGTFVRAGDTLGTVGNTGNAKNTPPHLHFGIYARGEGAIDPDAFIRPVPASMAKPEVRTSALGELAQTRRAVSLRAAPSSDSSVVAMLPAGRAVRIEGAFGPWVRTTADGQLAFVRARDLRVSAN